MTVSCEAQLAKLKKQMTQLLIANGEAFLTEHKHTNHYHNASNVFHRDVLVKNYGFTPKVAGTVASKLKRSGRLPGEYSKTTGLLRKTPVR